MKYLLIPYITLFIKEEYTNNVLCLHFTHESISYNVADSVTVLYLILTTNIIYYALYSLGTPSLNVYRDQRQKYIVICKFLPWKPNYNVIRQKVIHLIVTKS